MNQIMHKRILETGLYDSLTNRNLIVFCVARNIEPFSD